MSPENESQPFAVEVVQSDALTAIERVQIDTQIATAKRYPRNIGRVKAAMLSVATLDEETAAACFYTLPRGGKTIQGPSVRMAEIALSAFGNVKAATRILSVHTGENPHAVVQAVCHDMENNIVYAVEKRRRITPKRDRQNGGTKPVDDDDINLAVNAGSAIAFRDAVFKVVPGALVRSVYEAAKKVAVGDVKSLAAHRAKVVDRLKAMGATEDRIFAVVGVKKLEEITVEHVETLIGLGTALKDGSVTLEDAFPAAHDDAPKSQFRKATPATAPAAEPAPAAAPTPAPAPVLVTEAEVVTPTTTATTQAAPAAPATTPQEELAAFVVAGGHTFDEFQRWARHQQYLADELTGFDEVPTPVATKLNKHKTGVVNAIAKHKGGAR